MTEVERLKAKITVLAAMLETVHDGLRSGNVKAPPMMKYDPDAETLPLVSLQSLIEEALEKGRV